MIESRDLLEAIICCRQEEARCDICPLQEEICDTLYVDMITLPAELVDLIEKRLRSGKNDRYELHDDRKNTVLGLRERPGYLQLVKEADPGGGVGSKTD